MKKGYIILEVLFNNIMAYLAVILAGYIARLLTNTRSSGLAFLEGFDKMLYFSLSLLIIINAYLFFRQRNFKTTLAKLTYLYSSLLIIFILVILLSSEFGLHGLILLGLPIIILPLLVILVDRILYKKTK
ncbi:MAG: hypothetical protein KAU20_03975 [Nanoarchaeota archaeon]|nr:hypothetical protein [Nanoarchaeota archaeon]